MSETKIFTGNEIPLTSEELKAHKKLIPERERSKKYNAIKQKVIKEAPDIVNESEKNELKKRGEESRQMIDSLGIKDLDTLKILLTQLGFDQNEIRTRLDNLKLREKNTESNEDELTPETIRQIQNVESVNPPKKPKEVSNFWEREDYKKEIDVERNKDIKRVANEEGTRIGARSSEKPNLDYYDNRREKREDGTDVPYQGRYGINKKD